MSLGKIGGTLAAREILDLVRDDLKRVEEEIEVESAGSVAAVGAISSHMYAAGGKRLRPTLLLLSARLLGDVSPEAIRLAAVMEMVHTATLIHDDVIDMADKRRGRPSANAIWGNQVSVLAGDWLYMQAFQIALKMRHFEILDILHQLTQMMVEGELLQLERIGKHDITEADYMELVDRKTATLFSTCTRLGALIAKAPAGVVMQMGEFGWNLGMAFQLTDDILDFTSRETILGKPVGNDLQEGKVTLPLIYALADANREDARAVETVIKDGNYDRVPFSRILRVIEQHRGVERAFERAHTFSVRAREIMAGFADTPYRRALLTVTDLVTERDR